MPVNLKGKQYHTVAERITAFREACPATDGWGVETTIHAADDAIVIVHATIRDPQGRIIGQGLAEEVRTDRGVNSTSALENCETSAIGRALAAAGWGGDGEYASANEVHAAIQAQENGTTTAAARKMAKPPLADEKAMTDKQIKMIEELSRSHVWSDEERAMHAAFVKGRRTSKRASEVIDGMMEEIKKRKAIEADVAAEPVPVNDELPF